MKGKKFVDDVLIPFANAYETVSRADYESADGTDKVNLYLEHLRRLDNMFVKIETANAQTMPIGLASFIQPDVYRWGN